MFIKVYLVINIIINLLIIILLQSNNKALENIEKINVETVESINILSDLFDEYVSEANISSSIQGGTEECEEDYNDEELFKDARYQSVQAFRDRMKKMREEADEDGLIDMDYEPTADDLGFVTGVEIIE